MVSNYMQLLEKSFQKELTEDQASYMQFASEGAKRMYTLIDSLLIFSRATADTAFQDVDLNDVIDEVTRIVVSSSNRAVNINCGEMPAVLADHSQMVQVFQNIVANAVKYNDKEAVLISISHTIEDDAHRITIADNGIGIEARYREKVFELFKRLHHRDTYSGTGIGLSICKKIIHQMNGRIWIEDSPMGGAAFVFTIPMQTTPHLV
jgi:light-regulated signal transduction histidine kinase (bacteriophytochrome)